MAPHPTSEDINSRLRTELPLLRERYGVQRLALFGSFVKGTATTESDVDLLVELARPLGLAYVRLSDDLERVLGRKVDLGTFEALRRSLKDPRRARTAAEVLRTAIYV